MSSLSTAEQAQINLSVGGVVVSNYLSYLTMGIVLSATWTYFSKFPNDTWWFKALVILCVSMCIGDTIATGIWSYDWAVANYANPAVLAFTHWTLAAEPFLLATCGLTVQLFYAWRLWIMSMRKNWILPVVIGCLSISGWCIICWLAHTIATHKLISDLIKLPPLPYIWLGGSVAADALITSSMFYYLDLRFRIELHKMQQNQAGYRAPRRFRRLIARTVECNLLSLFAQAIAIGLFNNTRIGLYYLITNMMLVKVYTFSLLVSLNCRHPDNGHGTSEGGFSSSRGGDVELNVLGDRHTCAFPSTQIPVHIQRETTIEWQGQTKGPAFNVDEFF
ncbi:hypothetical protein BT96DRAFT_1022805 [Gymnopus androsaceus JB14]|uniref:DUF6534 domain-containing protein n=1 Tax=Gymnopus androsaceus JB14 TaxID=1447944 RepID=A0A6A4H7Z2_9AGAR|nr:hypothetical protein BT96DRAFT_1022805 [Gymnopus androsaceus JB14]